MSALRLTLRWIAKATGGRIVSGDPAMTIGEIAIDTRTLQAGDFFVALRGERFDAHAFVDDAVAKGVTGVMVGHGFKPSRAARRGVPSGANVGVVEVADTTKGLQQIAHAVRAASGTTVIAITGSAGKTTTKETIAALLEGIGRVVKNKGNLNNHIGLPLSLMRLRERPDVAVMELGMNHAGEISTLVAIAEPELRVWTNVGDAHIGFFASADAIADAKAEILEGARPTDVLVANADDPRVMARVKPFAGRLVTFGAAPSATVRVTEIEDRGVDGMRARVTTPAGEWQIETPLLGRGNLSNVLAAIAVALEFNVSPAQIAAAIARLTPADRRGAVHRLRDGIVLIDDSYNASPAALAKAIDVLARDAKATRKVAVIGEMLELGDRSAELHRASGRLAAHSGIGRLFAIGGAGAKAVADAAVDEGMDAAVVTYVETSEAAAASIPRSLRPGDLVLVKGSRGTRTDVIADRIIAELG
jgi:UDP-N-acetylmuramoyl-tripeptide--D-alanyl-D-alanine ligase